MIIEVGQRDATLAFTCLVLSFCSWFGPLKYRQISLVVDLRLRRDKSFTPCLWKFTSAISIATDDLHLNCAVMAK